MDEIKRDENGHFLPGQSGNPAGKPVGAKSFTTKVREALEKVADGTGKTQEQELIKSILENAVKKKSEPSQRLIWNYLDGMPAQKIGGDPDNPLVIQLDIEREKIKKLLEDISHAE